MRIRLVNKDGVLSSFGDVANFSLNDGVIFTFVFAFPFFWLTAFIDTACNFLYGRLPFVV